jgi:hypothetical protein
MAQERRSARRNGTEPLKGFAEESAMIGPLAAAMRQVCRNRGGTWVLLDEHLVAGRIPDLVMGRIDLDAFRERIRGGWGRPLSRTEVRMLRLLRPDRGTTVSWLARRLQVTSEHARKVLLELVASGFVAKMGSGSYVRAAPIRPILDRVITFELKLSDWREALIQARSHQEFADRAYVVFDDVYESRFLKAKGDFKRLGIGLISLSASTAETRRHLRGRRSPLRRLTAVMLAAERALGRLLGETTIQLPQSRLPNASDGSGRQEEPVLVGSQTRKIERLLAAYVH